MKIKMTQTIQGSLDGVTVRELVEGEQYDTVDSARGERLASSHIRNGVAIAAPAEIAPPDPAAAIPPAIIKQPKRDK
jgi:hypothetical protein